jgi:hypothetical protein
MNHTGFILCLALAASGAGCASSAAPAQPYPHADATPLTIIKPDASIPFANARGEISDWSRRADGSILIESGGRYYHASVMTPCPGLDTTSAIGFDSAPAGAFNKFSSIMIGRNRCPVTALDEVANPHPRH